MHATPEQRSGILAHVSHRSALAPWLIFMVVGLGALALSARLYQLENAHLKAHFMGTVDGRVTMLNAAIQTATRPVQHLSSLFALAGGDITEEAFLREARALPLAQEPRLISLQWVRLEHSHGREALIVRYSYSPENGEAPLGLNLLGDPTLGPWLRHASTRHEVAISPWYSTDGEIRMRAIRPVFVKGPDNQELLIGLVSGVYGVNRLLEAAWAGTQEPGIEIWVSQVRGAGVFHYTSGVARYSEAAPTRAPGGLSRRETIAVPGALWHLLVVASPGVFPHPFSALAIGLAILLSGFLLALYLRALQSREQLVGELVVQRTESLDQRTQELETVYGSAPVGLAVLDRQLHFVRVNDRMAELDGQPVGEHKGRRLRELVPWIADAAEEIGARVIEKGESVRNIEFHGGERFYNTSWLPLKNGAGSVWGVNVVFEETTDRRRLEDRARHLAEHDPLTDLPNRRLLIDLIDIALRSAQRTHRKVALLFLDLDRFKAVNDTLGHEVGDALLKAVSSRILSRVRRSDFVARLGGDEFTVLLTDLTRGDQAGELADEIVRTLRNPFYLGGHTLYITTSIGVSLYPDDSDNADGLLRRADLAMYDAKEKGRNTFRFYNPEMDRRSRERARIEGRLHEAMENGELIVLYQPEFDLRTSHVVGVEALVRWHHPELGMLEPDRFIPVAEETDLIVALDRWVLRAACAQAKRWLDAGHAPIKIAVNLSAKGFEHPALLGNVRANLTESGLSAEQLELELTERTVMRRVDQSIERMRDLVHLGVGIAIDDFGTGYSSLSYLKRLPISKLKIDRSFVHDIATDPDDRAIIEAITELGHTLRKRVIAEGVETTEQRDFLVASGCDEAQGFLFNGPLPPQEIGALLAR